MKHWVLLGALAVGSAGSAHAQEFSLPEDPFAKCAAIENDAARLACFDQTYASARAEAAVRAEEEQAREVAEKEREEANFGFSPAEVARRDEQTAAPPPTVQTVEDEDGVKIVARIAEVLYDARRTPVILLDNGQIWRAASNRTYRGSIREGWQVEVAESWAGGYRLTIEGKRGFISVTRVR